MNKNRARQVVEKYVECRNKKDVLSKAKSEAENNLIAATVELVTYMADSNLKSMKFDDLGQVVSKEPIPRPSYEKESEEAVMAFVRANGGSDLIKIGIHPSALSSFIREKLGEGVQIPECIKVFYQPVVSYTAGSNKTV